MKIHELKIKYEYYRDIVLGKKTFELRKDDRGYQMGDLIHFVDTRGKEFSWYPPDGTKALFRIVYILRDVPEYGLDRDYCILGIRHI